MKKRILSLFLAVVMFMTSGIFTYVDAEVTIGDVVVDEIIFRKVHTGYEITGSYIEIWGTKLDEATILFENSISGFTDEMGELQTDTPGFKKYYFNQSETINFGSRLAIEGTLIDLGLSNFPNISDADKKKYNVDNGDNIALTGANLDLIGTNGITASYGNLERQSFPRGGTDTVTPTSITVNGPPVPGGVLGTQSISIEQRLPASGPAANGSVAQQVIYVYYNAFSLVEDLGVTNPNLFPNTGAKGDEFYITADDLNPNRDYQIYFVTDLGEVLNSNNRADFVSLAIDYDGNEDKLTFKVPDRDGFDELEYTLILTDTQNDSVIAEQVLADKFSVVDASYLPTIEEIYPTQGPQEGADIQIDGRNLISINIPDLIVDADVKSVTKTVDGIEIEYDDESNGALHYPKYDGHDVTVKKEMIVKVGGKVTFLEDSVPNVRYNQATIDSIFVRAPSADDAETDPFKDVNIEMVITIAAVDNSFTYVFRQNVIQKDGFKFIPSSVTPVVDSIVPSTMHVTGVPGTYYTGEDMMLVIEGSNFLVNRYTDDSGNTFVNYPEIYIKTVNDQSLSTYDILLDPNVTITGTTGNEVKGVIYDMRTNSTADVHNNTKYIVNPDGVDAYKLDLKVVDDNGQIVAGTVNNDIGTRIIARLPRNVQIDVADFKNVLVVNPTRNSDIPGKKKMTVEGLQFVDTNDIPIIESVDPNVVTVDGGEEIVITGNNFQEGAKIWLDGKEIIGFERDISQSGDKIILKFTAPKGPAGKSQIVVQNPSGGVGTQDFYYVTSFNKDPIINDFVPPKGTAETLVVINGENFLKEDPTAETLDGLDALRIIGTRVFLDGDDVNDYNKDIESNIDFIPYIVPDVKSFIIKNDTTKKAELSPFYENIYIKDDSEDPLDPNDFDVYYSLTNDGDGNPAITDNLGVTYTFKYEVNKVNIYDQDGNQVGDLATNYSEVIDAGNKSGTATITIDDGMDTVIDKTLTIIMNNNSVFLGMEAGDAQVPRVPEYAESVVFVADTTPEEYYRMYVDFDNKIRFTNGKDNQYEFVVENSKLVMRKDVSNAMFVRDVTSTGFALTPVDGNPATITFTMQTPYKFDSDQKIVGHKAKVLNRTQIAFTVPTLDTGKGYKDLKVINPDTKYDEKTDEDGFYYIEQSSSQPKITDIKPAEGSVDGGYVVRIYGKAFEDNMSVYVDGVLVPPTDTNVALDGSYVNIKMPKLLKDLAEDYGVSFLEVPVVILNNDGGTDSREKGFKYIIPKSSPQINTILPSGGSTNGGTIVELVGYEFRFFEPYKNLVGGPGYDIGDELFDLYKDGVWNDLLDPNVPVGAITRQAFNPAHPYYAEFLVSPILPSVYFGEEKAEIVEYASGYLKVISPKHLPGTVEVYVVNNDSGVSNKVNYQFTSSSPTISSISPAHGKRQGQELRDFYGSGFFKGLYNGYKDDDDTVIGQLDNLDSAIRFADITNRDITRGEPNSGLINAERTTVELEGSLRVEYQGAADTITVSLTEDGKIYRRTFNNYDDSEIFIPMEMLRQLDASNNPTGAYYHPMNTKTDLHDGTTYENLVFEYIKIEIDDKRFYVDRGYAPKIEYSSGNQLIVTTPSYYTVGSVPVLLTNPDFGTATSTFQYTFPASEPKIYQVGPRELSPDGTSYYTKRTVLGGTQIEVLGLDFREDIKAYIGDVEANIAEKSVIVKTVDGADQTFDILILDVPAGQMNEIGLEKAIVVTNTDYGVANSSNAADIYGTDKKPMFFVYQQPLSAPAIDSITPEETSQYGGHIITILGSDFRTGATVTIGSKGGVPIANTTVSERGSKLTFVTPQGTLIPGEKTIQVENEDYGASGNDKSITIVSYPTVIDDVEFVDGTQVKWLSVEGGQKIRLKGDNFYDGAKVIFGGTRTKDAEDLTGEKGLFMDDVRYNIADGYLATEVEVISQTEMIVTTPLISLEDPYKITVLNADGGLSADNVEVLYSVPVPSDPVGLKLELIDNRYIRISDYTASGHKYYEIYYYLGTQNTSTIKSGEYLDMQYLGSTDLEPYRLPSITGVETMKSNERLIIGLKAVNEFGSSDWSNLEYLSYTQLKDVVELGDPDIDGDLGVPDGKDFISEVVGTELITTLSDKSDLAYIYIDLSTPNYDSISTRVVNVPGKIIQSSTAIVRVDYRDLDIQFSPITLNTKEFQTVYFKQNAYGRIETSEIEDAYSGYMLNQVPRGYKVVSKVVTIGFDAKNNDVTETINSLNGSLDIMMGYDPLILSGYSESKIEMYRFDKGSNTWTKLDYIIDQNNNVVSARTNLPGAYVLLVKRY